MKRTFEQEKNLNEALTYWIKESNNYIKNMDSDEYQYAMVMVNFLRNSLEI